MVATMLSRVLSSTKLGSSHVRKMRTEKDGTNDTQSNENTSCPPRQRTQSIERKRTIFFDDEKAGKTSKAGVAVTSRATSRKHSYASVKEDSTQSQSFLSRRLSSRPEDRSVVVREFPIRSSESTVAADDLDIFKHSYDSEVAVWDDDEAAVYSDSDAWSGVTHTPASLDSMPDEILDTIFSYVTLDADKDRYTDPKVDLFNLLFVSKPVHAAALRVLYRHVKMPQSKAFHKFNNAILEDPHLGSLVQCLDFSHFSSIGFGRARNVTMGKPYLTPKTLKAGLDRMTNLKAFLAHEHIDDELDTSVLATLINKPSLRALDLCASSSQTFNTSFADVCSALPVTLPNIQRLSLHECTTLRPQVFEALLPRLTHLTHLDVAHTMINDKALLSIPHTARLTHLNLERCNQITGSAVVEFLTKHPAARASMVYLNVFADASRYRLLSEEDVDELLPALPSTLRSLNLGGARINSTHVCALRALATHLEELGMKGANLSLSQDVAHILSLVSIDCDEELQHPEWRHSLRYLDLTDIKSVTQMSLTYSPTSITALTSMPLEVIEVGSSVLTDLSKRLKNVKNPDWAVRELGRRGWYVRQPTTSERPTDDYRPWKMGAKWWGMRKIPMFEQDTGGMYGYFMFKRA